MRKVLFTVAPVVLVLAALPFLRCWDYGLINLDDYLYVTMHETVCQWQGWTSIADFFTNVNDGIWMPLTWMSYAIDHILFSTWYGGFHLHSIVVHSINSVLVWLFIVKVLAILPSTVHVDVDRPVPPIRLIAAIAALVWAVHPLRCESVVFVASRKDVLSFFWEMLALISWVYGSEATDKRRAVVLTVFSSIMFVMGSMCKPSIMTFPLLCFLIDIFIVRRVNLLRYVFPFAYMLFLGAFAAWQQSFGGATGNFGNDPLYGRILGACAAFGIYLRNFVWPIDLAPQCLKVWPEWPRFMIPGVLMSGLAGFYFYRSARRYWDSRNELFIVEKIDNVPVRFSNTSPQDPVLAGAAWFAVAIAPMLGISSFGYHAFADRFTYIPAVGLSLLVAIALKAAIERIGQAIPLAAATCIVLALMALTWRQTGFWKDDITLFSHTLEVDGDRNAAAHCILANAHFEFEHDVDKTISEYEKAISNRFYYAIQTYPIYIIALAEAGRDSEIGEKLHLLEDDAVRVLGKEQARKVIMGSPDINPHHREVSVIFKMSRTAWCLADKNSLPVAGDILNAVDVKERETNPIWLYLTMWYEAERGNKDAAEAAKEKLRNFKRGYFRFRWLFDKQQSG